MPLAGQVRVFGVGGGSPGGVLLRGFGETGSGGEC